jgi:transcriptional regulator with XRE-family HTH domain
MGKATSVDLDGDASGRRQRLGAELRRLRDQAGISGRDLAQRISTSQSKVSRIESGAAVPSIPAVTAWAQAVGASSEVTDALIALTEAVFTQVHPWSATLPGLGHIQDNVQELESRALEMSTFQPSVVPGLLQTAEYARRVLTLFHPHADSDIPAAVAARLDRQVALFEEARRFSFLITEAALRWRPGPPRLLLAQLDRIASLLTLENVSIGLIPQGVEATAPMTHGFVILDGAEHDGSADDARNETSVLVEVIHGCLVVNDPESVELYQARWSRLRQMALFDDAAQRFIGEIAADIKVAGK